MDAQSGLCLCLHERKSGFLSEKHFFIIKLGISTSPSVLTVFLGAQNKHLIEMVLLSTHNIIMFRLKNEKNNFQLQILFWRPGVDVQAALSPYRARSKLLVLILSPCRR